MTESVRNGWYALSAQCDVQMEHDVPVRVACSVTRAIDSESALAGDIHRYTGLHVALGPWGRGERPSEREAPVQVGRLNLRLMLARDAAEGYATLGLCRIVERRADNKVILDAQVDEWTGGDVQSANQRDALLAFLLAEHGVTLPAMKAANWGRIINVASVHGLVASAQKSAYVAAKHGIVGLTKVTALENATTGVTCNAICPGWVLTPLVQKQVDAKAQAMGLSNEEAKKVLLGEKEPSMQFTTPEELGALAVFFCSPAANNVRGVAWNMDGGWTAQ